MERELGLQLDIFEFACQKQHKNSLATGENFCRLFGNDRRNEFLLNTIVILSYGNEKNSLSSRSQRSQSNRIMITINRNKMPVQHCPTLTVSLTYQKRKTYTISMLYQP